jgi:hypothetical protein
MAHWLRLWVFPKACQTRKGAEKRERENAMFDNIHHPEFRWQTRLIVETRRQRKTGKTIFRVWRVSGPGDDGLSYIEYDDPVVLAQSLFWFLQHGVCQVEWKGQPAWKPAADVVALGR